MNGLERKTELFGGIPPGRIANTGAYHPELSVDPSQQDKVRLPPTGQGVGSRNSLPHPRARLRFGKQPKHSIEDRVSRLTPRSMASGLLAQEVATFRQSGGFRWSEAKPIGLRRPDAKFEAKPFPSKQAGEFRRRRPWRSRHVVKVPEQPISGKR